MPQIMVLLGTRPDSTAQFFLKCDPTINTLIFFPDDIFFLVICLEIYRNNGSILNPNDQL